MIPYPSITTFCYLVTLLSLVSSSPLFFLVLIVLPQVTLYTYPRYLGSSPCTHYLILDITNAPLTCFLFLVSHRYLLVEPCSQL